MSRYPAGRLAITTSSLPSIASHPITLKPTARRCSPAAHFLGKMTQAILSPSLTRPWFAITLGMGNPLGKHLAFDLDKISCEIVGVIGDARYNEVREGTRPTIYLDVFRAGQISSQLTLRTSLDPWLPKFDAS